jgi:hypothetical protein
MRKIMLVFEQIFQAIKNPAIHEWQGYINVYKGLQQAYSHCHT